MTAVAHEQQGIECHCERVSAIAQKEQANEGVARVEAAKGTRFGKVSEQCRSGEWLPPVIAMPDA